MVRFPQPPRSAPASVIDLAIRFAVLGTLALAPGCRADTAGNGVGGTGAGTGGNSVGTGDGGRSGPGGSAGSAGGQAASGGGVPVSGNGGRGGAGATTAGGTSGQAGATVTGGANGQAGAPMTGGAGGGGGDTVAVFQNGVFWNDVAAKRIEAHGAGLIKVGATFYWVGEDRSQNNGTFRAMNLYASTDLTNWEFRKAIITPATTPELATAGRIIERPKIVYNDTTQQFVLWLHWDGNAYADAQAGVFSSPTIDGSYAFHAFFRPNANMSRDDTLFKDDDGGAYFISAANNNADLVIYQLTPDYLDIARQVITLWPGSFREAPAMFKSNGRYFLLSSGATGWDPNQAKYGSATSIAGPWSALQNVGDGTAFDTQSAYVIPIVGSAGTTYIYAGDRWMDPNLVGSKYIWLPLTVSGTTLGLAYAANWHLNLTTGRVTIP